MFILAIHDRTDRRLTVIQRPISPSIQAILNDAGVGTFSLLRFDPQAAAEVLAIGNIVHVWYEGRDVFQWVIAEIVDAYAESGGETVTCSGPGTWAILDYALLYPQGWPPEGGTDAPAQYGANILTNGDFEATGGDQQLIAPGWQVDHDNLGLNVSVVEKGGMERSPSGEIVGRCLRLRHEGGLGRVRVARQIVLVQGGSEYRLTAGLRSREPVSPGYGCGVDLFFKDRFGNKLGSLSVVSQTHGEWGVVGEQMMVAPPGTETATIELWAAAFGDLLLVNKTVYRVSWTDGEGLRLRSWPGTSADVLVTMPEGTVLEAVGAQMFADGYSWLPVVYNGITGWCATAYLSEETTTTNRTSSQFDWDLIALQIRYVDALPVQGEDVAGMPLGTARSYINRRIPDIVRDIVETTRARLNSTDDPDAWPIRLGKVEYNNDYDVIDGTIVWKDQRTAMFRFDHIGMILRGFQESAGDFTMRGLTLDYEVHHGHDRSRTVIFRQGVDIEKIPEKRVDAREAKSSLIVEGAGEGTSAVAVEVVDEALRSKYGVREGFLDRKSGAHMLNLRTEGQAALAELERQTEQIAVTVLVDRKKPFVHYGIGDWIRLVSPELGIDRRYRVWGISAAPSPEAGLIRVDLDLNAVNYDRFVETVRTQESRTNALEVAQKYPQGSVTLYQVDADDQIDGSHPMELRFFMPNPPLYTHQVRLSFQGRPYKSIDPEGISYGTSPGGIAIQVNGVPLDPVRFGFSDAGGSDLEIGRYVKKGWNTVTFSVSTRTGRITAQTLIQTYLNAQIDSLS